VSAHASLKQVKEALNIDPAQKLELKAMTLDVKRMPPAAPKPGDTVILRVTGRTRLRVYGSGPYSTDSDPATAAVHAGVLANDEDGLIKLTYVAVLGEYPASDANGVKTLAYKSIPKNLSASFTVERIPVE
jgi:hypothetical protein